MIHLTGSGLDRGYRCPPSLVLPQTRNTNVWAQGGNIIHGYLHKVATVGEAEAILSVEEEHREACSAIDLSALPASRPEAYAAEVAFAYDPATDTARELGRGLSREEAYQLLRPGEIPGTADVVGLTEDSVVILDYKTGWADLGPVRRNLQLRFYALCAARVYGRNKARVGIIRVRPNDEPFWDCADLDLVDLDATAFSITETLDRATAAQEVLGAGGVPTTSQGEHCRYCPAFNSCPGKMALARELASLTEPTEFTPAVLTEENFPAVWDRLVAAEAVLARVREVLEEFSRVRPVPAGDGYVIGPRPYSRDTINPDIAQVVLGELVDEQAANDAVCIAKETGKGLIEDALRKAKARGLKVVIKKKKEEVLGAIRDRGGITTSTTYPVSRHKPKPGALPASTTNEEKHDAA